jgi:2Fe-2S ferredoxin
VPRIEFLPSAAGSTKVVDVPEGGPLADICDRHLAPLPYSCRSATCATCHVEVLEGEAWLEEPLAEERDLLASIGGAPGTRLACQAVVRPGAGRIRIRPVEW